MPFCRFRPRLGSVCFLKQPRPDDEEFLMKKALLLPFFFSVLVMLTPGAAFSLGAGDTPPDFTLTSLDGEEVSLSDFKGRVIILKLATTWCPTCKQQNETFLANDRFLSENDAVVIDVFVQDSEKMVRKYMGGREFGMTFVPLVDDGQAYRAYTVYLIPRVLVIDREFKVLRDGGYLPSSELRSLVKEAAAEKQDS